MNAKASVLRTPQKCISFVQNALTGSMATLYAHMNLETDGVRNATGMVPSLDSLANEGKIQQPNKRLLRVRYEDPQRLSVLRKK